MRFTVSFNIILLLFVTGGELVLRGDGSITFLKESTSPAVVAFMVSKSGGDIVPGDSW